MISKKMTLKSLLGGGRRSRMPELGPRETDALDHLWESGSLSAQELRQRIDSTTVSLNTIQSTLERLHRKGIVSRAKDGRLYRYSAALTRAELISRLLRDLAEDVGGGELAPMISGFADFVAGDDPDVEEKLTRLIQQSERRRD